MGVSNGRSTQAQEGGGSENNPRQPASKQSDQEDKVRDTDHGGDRIRHEWRKGDVCT